MVWSFVQFFSVILTFLFFIEFFVPTVFSIDDFKFSMLVCNFMKCLVLKIVMPSLMFEESYSSVKEHERYCFSNLIFYDYSLRVHILIDSFLEKVSRRIKRAAQLEEW